MKTFDTAYLWRGAPLYLSAVFLAFDASKAAVSGDWVPVLVFAVPAAVVASLTARSGWKLRRGPYGVLRAELLALVRSREGTADGWLHRDEHLLMKTDAAGPRWLRRWYVYRTDEEQARELDETGTVAAAVHMYSLLPVCTPVMHYLAGGIVSLSEDGELEVSEEQHTGRLRYIWQHWRMDRAGVIRAGEEELRELISQFREAEPVSADA